MSMRRAEIVTGRIIGADALVVTHSAQRSLHHEKRVHPLPLTQRRTIHLACCDSGIRQVDNPYHRLEWLMEA